MEFAAYEKLRQSKMNFLKHKKNSDFFNSLKIKICFQALYEVVAFVSLVTTFTMKMTLHLLKKSYFHIFMDKKSHEIQKQPPRVFCKKSVLRNFVNFTGKTPALESLLNKVRPTAVIKKRLQHRCFPVKFAKFRRTTF